MEPFYVRSADGAPAPSGDEWYGQVPESVITDRDLSDGAVRCYSAIRLCMARDDNYKLCLDPLRVLARMQGITEREARYRVAELESRGHVARERVRSIAGSPQGIRPLAKLRTRNGRSAPRNDGSGCTRNVHSMHPEQEGPAPGTVVPGTRNGPSALLREEEKEDSIQTAGSIGVRDEPARPTLARKEETARDTACMQNYNPPLKAEALSAEEAEAGRAALRELASRARKNPGRWTGKSTPGAESRDSTPDTGHSTPQPAQESRPVSANGNITPNI